MIKIYKNNEISLSEILARDENAFNVSDTVAEIIKDVRKNGDEALFRYCEKFDHAKLSSLEVKFLKRLPRTSGISTKDK